MLTVTKVTLEKGKKTLLKELSFSLKVAKYCKLWALMASEKLVF